MKKKKMSVLILVVVCILFGLTLRIAYNKDDIKRGKKADKSEDKANLKSEKIETSQKDKVLEDEEFKTVDVFKVKLPEFIDSLTKAEEVKIDPHYENDPSIEQKGWSGYKQNYTFNDSNEKCLSVSKVKDRKGKFNYGPLYLPVFMSSSSHFYQGTPIFIDNPKEAYSVSFIGLQISNRDLVSEFKIELGIDYVDEARIRQYWGMGIKSIFGIKTAYACGPGMFLELVGNSELIFETELDGIYWYKLAVPIKIYNLPLKYEYFDDNYSKSIKDLSKGNLKMHIMYKPNDLEGLLKIRLAAFVLSNQSGKYYQPVWGKYFNHRYIAYLR